MQFSDLIKSVLFSAFMISILSAFNIYSSLSPFGNKYWLIESSTIQPALDVNMDGKPDTDLLVIREVCEKDDADLFREDGIIITHRGKVLCDEYEEEEETGTWLYDAKTKKMTVKKDESRKSIEYTVKEANANRIVLITQYKSANNIHTITTTFKAR
ncbi:hypothetical protein [Gynurincola endophyticus]|uniref:hypothetical protein n=1 Tax=Gynurincola endophyticus TaxID=2479004 RepID=UPI0013157FAA|nr:hypothetical protein [Gynurincola endophyticus]